MKPPTDAAARPGFAPDHPGALVRALLGEVRLSASRAAVLIGVTPPTLNNVVRGTASISPDMALRLSRLFGNTAEMWMRLQERYDLWHRAQALACDLDRITPVRGDPIRWRGQDPST